MNTSTWDCSANASIAAAPVSPEVAPMIVALAFRRRKTRFIAWPSHCMAKSLKASVGPWKSSSVNRLLSTCVSGAVAEAGIGGCGQGVHFCVIEILVDKGRHEPRGRFRIRNAAQGPDRIRRQMGNGERHVEAAVACETGEKGVREAQRRRRAARRNIIHDKRILGCL